MTAQPHVVYLGFGSNLGDSSAQIRLAWETLRLEPIIAIARCSPLYRTVPIGGAPGQPDYVNAACRAETCASPRTVLDLCLGIERRLGRVRKERWGPRTIDIDLLLYDNRVIDEPGLAVPHPGLRERLFALVPLADVAAQDMKLPPDGASLKGVIDLALATSGEAIEDWKRRVVE